ncbi:MAG: hypothetical protein JKY53_10730 [Flavobacteriales bacterium]|nr:hypothetical protein [Flavobacteriales bacterium]
MGANLLVGSISGQNPLCYGDTNGVVSVAIGSGLPPYLFSWNLPAQTTASITGLFSGMYNCIITDSIGCYLDFSISLTDPISDSVHRSIPICLGDWSPGTIINGLYVDDPGIYYETTQTNNGCDSTTIYELWNHPQVGSTLPSISICEQESALIFGQQETIEDIYYGVFESVSGCDSIVTVSLNVEDVWPDGNSVSLWFGIPGVLYVPDGPYLFNWIDCSTNIAISGADSNYFFVSTNGSYAAVATSVNGCSDTTDC